MKKITLLLTLSLLAYPITSLCEQAMPPAPGMMGMPQMTPEEMAKWQEEVTKEIDTFVNTLSPEEQAQFHKDVDELTKVMSQMSEEELVEFIGSMFPEEGAMPPMPVPAPMEETAVCPLPTPMQEKPQEPVIPAKSIEAAIKLIDDITTYTERFLRKAQIIPELPGKIEQWVEKNKIKEWNADITWEILKNKIELFIHKLQMLKELDPKTKQHKHLSNLIQQENLYNNLSHVKDTLERWEPKVEAPSFGLGKVSSSSRQAIRAVLSNFVEAFYRLRVLDTINKLLEKYEPRAKTLYEEEETSRKKAVEESKKARIESPKRETKMPETGKRSGSGYDYGTDYGYPSYGGGYAPYYEPSFDQYYPAAQPAALGTPTAKSSGKPTGGAGKEGSKEGGAPKAGAPAGGGEAGAKGKEEAAKKKEEKPIDPLLIRKLDKLDKAMQEAAEALTKGQLKTIYAHMFDSSPVDIDTAINYMPAAKKKLKNVLDQLKSFKLSQAAEGTKELSKEIKDIFDKYKPVFEDFYAQVFAISPKVPTASADKQYAYFKGLQRDRASITAQVPTPDSLEDIARIIQQIAQELKVTLKTEMKPQAPKGGLKEEASKKETEARAEPQAQKKEKEEKNKAAAAPRAQQQQVVSKRAGARAAAPVAAPLEGIALQRMLQRIDQDFDALDAQLLNLDDMQKHMNNINEQASAQRVQAINTLTNHVERMNREIQELKARTIDAQRKTVQDALHDIYADHRQLLTDALRVIQAIQALPVISPDKHYAYLGGQLTPAQQLAVGQNPDLQESMKVLAQDIPHPASLQALADALRALEKLMV